MKKILAVFLRDLKVNTKDFMVLYILIFPILAGIAINLLVPSINDTNAVIAVVENENPDLESYLEEFAKVETFSSREKLEKRIMKRDNIMGILKDDQGELYILGQGNEPELVVTMAKVLKSFYDLELNTQDATAEIIEFGKTVPPMKKMLVNLIMLMIPVLTGMIVAINIIEEKVDNTISAVNVTTLSRKGYIVGKSIIGVLASLFGTVALLLITGFTNVNLLQILMGILSCTLIGIMIGFVQGINSDDIMTAAGSIKLLLLPLVASVAVYELLGSKWQVIMYWSPFYWVYKNTDLVLMGEGTYGGSILYTFFVLIIVALIFAVVAPKVRKGLEK